MQDYRYFMAEHISVLLIKITFVLRRSFKKSQALMV